VIVHALAFRQVSATHVGLLPAAASSACGGQPATRCLLQSLVNFNLIAWRQCFIERPGGRLVVFRLTRGPAGSTGAGALFTTARLLMATLLQKGVVVTPFSLPGSTTETWAGTQPSVLPALTFTQVLSVVRTNRVSAGPGPARPTGHSRCQGRRETRARRQSRLRWPGWGC
jgi:hypothetical protein